MIWLFAILSIIVEVAVAKNWAYLVAGSTEFTNYRHQSNVAHANRYLMSQGFDIDSILLLSRDDIARSTQNKKYNYLRNMPNGPNNYVNIRVDYKRNVTESLIGDTFSGNINAIRKMGTGRYLDVKKKDNVLVYLTDHGGQNLFVLPDGELLADHFVVMLRKLKSKCNSVLVIFESCYSGSMFEGLLTDKDEGILAITSASPTESTYAKYYDEELDTFLTDEFSSSFLQYMDKVKTSEETIDDLFTETKESTKKSHPQMYGDMKMKKQKLSTFFGHSTEPKVEIPVEKSHNVLDIKVPVPDVDAFIANMKLSKNSSDLHSLKVIKTDRMIERMFESFKLDVISSYQVDVSVPAQISNEKINKCYKKAREHYFSLFDMARKHSKSFPYMSYLNKACQQGIPTREIMQLLQTIFDNQKY